MLQSVMLAILFILLVNRFEVCGGLECLNQVKCSIDNSNSRPVCGNDGRTYSSYCLLQLASCNGHPVTFVKWGKCGGAKQIPLETAKTLVPRLSKCMRERNQAIGHARSNDLIMLGVYIPNCEPDGSFAPVQCLNASRFCWCVDGDGKEIQGTRARSRQPKCPTRSTAQQLHTERPPQRSGKKAKPCTNCKGCSKEVRAIFTEKLIKLLFKEFNPSSYKAPGQLDVMGTFHMLRWKFTHLDSNGDYMLQIRELHGFLKITKKAIHPKKCSRTFVTYCDRNGDRKVSIDEWYSCLGVKAITKCTGDYLEALEKNKQLTGASRSLLPSCASDGSYLPTQCHHSTGYCWCVDVVTGKPIPHATKNANSLTCSKIVNNKTSTNTAKKECDQALWISFKRYILKLFRKEVEEDLPSNSNSETENLIRSQRRSARSGDLRLLGTFLTDNQVLIWKFNRLDRNKDKHLEQNEFLTSRMKKHLGHVKRGRKCGKKLFECDTDKDKKLSMVEWALCLRPGRVILLQ